MRRNQMLILCLLMNLSVLLIAPTSETQTRKPQKRALLVGIDYYQDSEVPPTRGAEEDAKETKRILIENYGFRESDIHMLLGSDARAQRIKDEFENWLIQGTSPGDQVFFQYAGHGTQVNDEDRDESTRTPGDTEDEALAPFDVTLTRTNVITDDELGLLINQLSGRMAVLVFDSCNSGTVSRGIGAKTTSNNLQSSVRYLPSLKELENLKARSGARGIADDYVVLPPSSGSRELNLVVDKESIKAGGVVIFSAAQSHQLAYSVYVRPDYPRGAFTYLLNQYLKDSRTSIKNLQSSLAKDMPGFLRSKDIRETQTPYFECFPASLENQPLFGEALTAPAVAMSNPVSTISLTIRTLEGKVGNIYRFGTVDGKPYNESVSYEIQTSEPGYLYLIVFSKGDQAKQEDNVATRIFPNINQKDNRVEKGAHKIFRDPITKEGFLVTEPAGRDVVIALLTSSKLNFGQDTGYEKESYKWEEVFDLLNSKRFSQQVEALTRGQSGKGQTASVPLEMTKWQSASIEVEAKKINK